MYIYLGWEWYTILFDIGPRYPDAVELLYVCRSQLSMGYHIYDYQEHKL